MIQKIHFVLDDHDWAVPSKTDLSVEVESVFEGLNEGGRKKQNTYIWISCRVDKSHSIGVFCFFFVPLKKDIGM